TDASFMADVLELSRTKPVVVDFWAPWCGPCRMLGPIIERVAAETNGEVLLAKLNTDENPAVAQRYQIQGIPAVKAFKDGKVIAEFTGAVPESQVRAFFAKLAPSPAERAAEQAQARAASGDTEGAEAGFRAALAASSINADAIVGLATILLARGDRDEAERILSRIPTDRRAKVLKHRTFLQDFAEKHAKENIESEAKAAPSDPRARYRWGVMLAANGTYESALEELLESVRLDRKFADGAARKAVLAIFDILGMESPVTREYQRRLSSVLF
ncbi:MAG: thioredoxin, partial [Tepidiformaceae bacterium]